jgi:hypothetical protein
MTLFELKIKNRYNLPIHDNVNEILKKKVVVFPQKVSVDQNFNDYIKKVAEIAKKLKVQSKVQNGRSDKHSRR